MANERTIEFKTEHDITLRGWLKLPAGEGPHPLVIMAHGFGGLKEWAIPVVAESLVADGYATLAFDYRNFGDSDGSPREEVDHPGQVADWRNAITFALTLDEIDKERIALWGTSLGGRNVLIVGALDRRVACIYAQVPAIDWADTVLYHQNNASQRRQLLDDFDEDRLNRYVGKEPRYERKQQTPGTETAEFMARLTDDERRNWKAQLTLRSYEPTVASNALPFVGGISPTPLCVVVVDDDVITPTNKQLEAYEAALEPKELHVLPGRHYDVYFTPLREQTTNIAREFFGKHLR